MNSMILNLLIGAQKKVKQAFASPDLDGVDRAAVVFHARLQHLIGLA